MSQASEIQEQINRLQSDSRCLPDFLIRGGNGICRVDGVGVEYRLVAT